MTTTEQAIDLPEMDRQIHGLTEILMDPNKFGVPIHARQGLNERLIRMVSARKNYFEHDYRPYEASESPETFVEPLLIDEYKTKDELQKKLSELDDGLKNPERPFLEEKRQQILEQRTELIARHKQLVDAENLQIP